MEQIDYLAVIIAAVLYMLIGFVWYSKYFFSREWERMAGIHAKERKDNKWPLFWECVVALVTAYALAFFENAYGVTTVADGVFTGFCVWLGFVVTTQLSSAVWLRSHPKMFFIDAGGRLISFLVMGGVIGA